MDHEEVRELASAVHGEEKPVINDVWKRHNAGMYFSAYYQGKEYVGEANWPCCCGACMECLGMYIYSF